MTNLPLLWRAWSGEKFFGQFEKKCLWGKELLTHLQNEREGSPHSSLLPFLLVSCMSPKSWGGFSSDFRGKKSSPQYGSETMENFSSRRMSPRLWKQASLGKLFCSFTDGVWAKQTLMFYRSIENNQYCSDYIYSCILVPVFWTERSEYAMKWLDVYGVLFSLSEGKLKHITYSSGHQ